MRSAAPIVEGLGEVGVGLGNVPMAGDIEQTTDADGGVGDEAEGFVADAAPAALEDLIDETAGGEGVAGEVADGLAGGTRDDAAIDAGGRLDDSE